MIKIVLQCMFGGQKAPFSFYIGNPKTEMHPFSHQTHWLSKERGGHVPEEYISRFAKINEFKKKTGLSTEEVCGLILLGDKIDTQAAEKEERNCG